MIIDEIEQLIIMLKKHNVLNFKSNEVWLSLSPNQIDSNKESVKASNQTEDDSDFYNVKSWGSS